MIFYHKIDWKDIRVVQTLIPENTGKIIFKENPEMQKMLLAGYGTFCGVDFGGALISSKGKFDIEYLGYIFNLKYYFSVIYIYNSITFMLFFCRQNQ